MIENTLWMTYFEYLPIELKQAEEEGKNVELYRKEIEEISEREADYVTRCPECGEIIDVTGGCYTCRSCGFSKCE